MIAAALEKWYRKAKRAMPWRVSPSPYVCWLSEIMLQQTTYAGALPYYERFLKTFPTVEALARADEAAVLKAWEGLGYYARARNLAKAAKVIVAEGWPVDSVGWAALPGVGPYTAAALSSVLNGEPLPVVDGNVARVFARYWLLSDDFKKLPAREQLKERLLPEIQQAQVPGDFNQAMMELGALVCTPTAPNCIVCPLKKGCQAYKTGTQADYPVKAPKKALPIRHAQVVIVKDDAGRVLLVQNNAGGLLKGLWELPVIESAEAVSHTFSHFKQELQAFSAVRSDATFQDPHTVPLTTTTKRLLGLV